MKFSTRDNVPTRIIQVNPDSDRRECIGTKWALFIFMNNAG